MKRKLFSLWLIVLAVCFTTHIRAQVTIGNTNGIPKPAEKFSALEVISNGSGGLRLPQLSTADRNKWTLSGTALANGLTIYNTTTKCVEYWNSERWISLCEGTSMTTISPQPCNNVAADGTGCDQTFTVTDPDCPNGPFSIAIMAGSEYATLTDINSAAGTFKVNFKANESITPHTVLVRVTSSCTGQFKDFLFMQNAITCDTTLGTAPAISPSTSALTLCTGGAVYLSIPAATANLSKVVWTRNGIEVARGVNYYTATLPGIYNISLGAAGCNELAGNAHTITESGTAPAIITTILASNNGQICGTGGKITLTAVGASGTVSWFKNGILDTSKTGAKITLTASDAGDWFAAAGSAGCFSKPSNTVTAVVQTPSGTPITVDPADVLINNKPIDQVTSFCSGGSLILKVNNPQPGVSYTWYNDQTIITSPYSIPASATDLLIRMVATDNSGAACPVEASTTEVPITGGAAPGTPTITSLTGGYICDGSADLTITPKETGTYTYQWYKDGVAMSETAQTITVKDPGVTYTGTVTNATGCVSAPATRTMSTTPSGMSVIDWKPSSDTAYNGAVVTYGTTNTIDTPATYEWTVDGGATKLSTTASANTITFPTSGTTVNIKVKATNPCGTSAEITKTVTLSPLCPTPTVTAATSTALSTVAGIGVAAKVNVAGNNQEKYQWYTNTTAVTTGGTVIAGATSATVTYTPATTAAAGTVYLYCVVTNGCTPTTPVASPVFTVTVTANPASLTLGSGTFAGKTCFDINKSNFGGSCGLEAARTGTMTNFATPQNIPYIFTASATGVKSNLRFVVIDELGAVQSTDAADRAVPGTVSNSQVVTLNVLYKATLSDVGGLIYGRTTDQAVNVKIYAIYFDGSKDVSVPLNIKIQDCACCGAYVAAGVWKNFMCHNLGADQSLDPATVGNNAILGDYYQYGQKNPIKLGVVSSWTNTWDRTTTNPLKGVNDPCPAGYRIPTKAEWQGVINPSYNTQTHSAVWAAVAVEPVNSYQKFGSQLYLPIAGSMYSATARQYVSFNSWYAVADFGSNVASWLLQVGPSTSSSYIGGSGTYSTPVGMPVRCIEQ